MNENQYFEDIYQQYHKRIYDFLNSHIHNPAVAEELAHDVFVAVYRNLHTYDSQKSFITTWLYAIAANRLKNYYKKVRNREYSYDALEEVYTGMPECGRNDMLQQEQKLMLDEAIQRLPERSGKIVKMKYYLGMTSVEIGSCLGISPGNVRIILKRSLGGMRKMMC